MAGGYVAGRMRPRWHDTPQQEVEFRDGLHGGLVWAVGMVIGALLLFAAAGATARTGADVVGKAAVTAAASATDPMDLVLDTLLRPATVGRAPAATAPTAPGTRAPAVTDDPRAEIKRILASSLASGSMSDQDRTYLVQLIAQRTGLSQEEAAKRVNAAINAAREAADKARRAAVLTGFVTPAALVISFGAAWWAALKGGQHRDNSVPATFELGRRYLRRDTPVR